MTHYLLKQRVSIDGCFYLPRCAPHSFFIDLDDLLVQVHAPKVHKILLLSSINVTPLVPVYSDKSTHRRLYVTGIRDPIHLASHFQCKFAKYSQSHDNLR